MRGHQLHTQCARALRSAVQTPRSSIPSTTRLPLRPPPARSLHSTTLRHAKSNFPATKSDSSNEGTQKDIPTTRANFSELDVLGGTPAPSTSVDVCMYDGFGLNSGVTISDGDGALLINGEAFSWRPWEVTGEKRLINEKGQVEIPKEAFGVLDVLWPRPDLLIIGIGRHAIPLSPATRKVLAELGLRVDIMDTRNAASQFNLLATERGVSEVAAALIPFGWEEGVGAA